MNKLAFPLAIAAAMVLVTMLVAPAQAQLSHTWVASNGSDATNCDRPTPCATFSGALGKTSANGEITCVDSGNYGGLVINKSITINCLNAIGSTTFVGGSNIGLITVTTAASDVVILRGLDLDGLGNSVSGTISLINFSGAGTLHVDKVKINTLHTSGGNGGSGIRFTPNGPARLDVSDSFISDNGSTGFISAGIFIQPTSGVTANVVIERSVINNNRFGIIASGSSGGTIRGMVSDSSVSGNTNNGITVSSSGTNVVLGIDNVKLAGNNFGLVATGANAGMLVRHSFIMGNNTGLNTGSGGVLLSYGDNSVNGNNAGETFSGPVGLK